VLHTIVEGEPGIFPDPVARILRSIGGLFRRTPKGTGSTTDDATGAAGPDATPDRDGGGPPGGPGQSGDST
jgi:hypothetical protein